MGGNRSTVRCVITRHLRIKSHARGARWGRIKLIMELRTFFVLTDECGFGEGDDASGVFPHQAVPSKRVKIPAGFKGAEGIGKRNSKAG